MRALTPTEPTSEPITNPATEPTWLLSRQEMQNYRQDGLVRPDLRLAPPELAALRARLDDA